MSHPRLGHAASRLRRADHKPRTCRRLLALWSLALPTHSRTACPTQPPGLSDIASRSLGDWAKSEVSDDGAKSGRRGRVGSLGSDDFLCTNGRHFPLFVHIQQITQGRNFSALGYHLQTLHGTDEKEFIPIEICYCPCPRPRAFNVSSSI
jgi:hypothetical protein